MTPPSIAAVTTSPSETQQVAEALAAVVRAKDLILLVGDLGAGKTAFTQGFGRGLGVEERITSPTFALVRGYRGRIGLNHLDVYRIEQIEEALDLGLSELLDDDSVTVIEWGDTIVAALPRDFLEISITFGDGDEDRRLELRAIGPSWVSRFDQVRAAVEPWVRSC